MPNKYKYRHNDRLIHSQYNNKLEEINEELNKILRTKNADVFNAMLNNINELILHLGEPSFENRQNNFDFNSEEYNKNITEIYDDINTAYEMLNTLQKMIKKNRNYADLFTTQIEKQVKNIQKYAENLDIYTQQGKTETMSISENFGSKTTIETADTDAEVMPSRGIVTLKSEGQKKNVLGENTEISIMETSNGFPGRLHELKNNYEKDTSYYLASGDIFDQDSISRTEDEPAFYAAENPHIHTANLIDGDDDTHFEYEICNFEQDEGVANSQTSPAIPEGTEMHGARFENGELWAREPVGEDLELHLKLKLDEPKKLNFIDISKYKIPVEGYKMPELKALKIAPDLRENPEHISQYRQIEFADYAEMAEDKSQPIYEDKTTNNNVVTFPPQQVQVIVMVFRQDESYSCPIGHNFWKQMPHDYELDNILHIDDEDDKLAGKRIEGLQYNKNTLIEEAEAGLDKVQNQHAEDMSDESMVKALSHSALTAAIGPVGVQAGAALADSGDIHSASSKKLQSENVISGLDILDGWRYSIALKNIFAADVDYAQSSQLITKNYQVPGKIKEIELDAHQYLPEKFYESDEDKQWIEYKFSLDDGESWHEISPQERQDEDIPNKYYVNIQKDLMYVDDNQAEIIETEDVPNTLKIKINLQRPTDIPDAHKFSPRVNRVNYQVSISNGGASDEY